MDYHMELFYTSGVGYGMDFLLPDTEGQTEGGGGFLGKTIEEAIKSIIERLPRKTPNKEPITLTSKTRKYSPSERDLTSEEELKLNGRLRAARPNIEFIF